MHMSGYVREQFIDLLEASGGGMPPDSPEARRVIGKVWNCTDTLPRVFCEDLGLPLGSSYASAAQHIRRQYLIMASH